MAKEEILHCWIGYIGRIIQHHLIALGRPMNQEKLCQYPFPEQPWINIGNFIENFARTSVDRSSASLTLFGGNTYSFWEFYL